jgi:lipid-A-disaccharide synthase
MSDRDGPLVYLIACEASGDQIGAHLMRALMALTGDKVRFAGLGGPAMTAAGLKSLFEVHELALLGVFEVLPKARTVLARVKQTVADIEATKPDILVTIDSWGFTGRIHERLTKRGSAIPRVRYVAPQVWAWRPKRAKQLSRWIHHLLTLLPFEPPYFERYGLKATWVGHPVIESGFGMGDGAALRKRYGIAPGVPVLGLLPGSRRSEVSRLLPVFREAAARLAQRHPTLHVLIATTDSVAHEVYTGVRHADDWTLATTVIMDGAERPDAFAACDVALAASGTVSLELALARVPHVIAYKVNPLSALAFRMLTKTRYVNLVNVLVGHEAVPERLQGKCRADILVDDLAILMRDEPRRAAQAADFAAALSKLSPDGALPSRRAAVTILGLVASKTP